MNVVFYRTAATINLPNSLSSPPCTGLVPPGPATSPFSCTDYLLPQRGMTAATLAASLGASSPNAAGQGPSMSLVRPPPTAAAWPPQFQLASSAFCSTTQIGLQYLLQPAAALNGATCGFLRPALTSLGAATVGPGCCQQLPFRTNRSVRCAACDITLNSQHQARQHYNGKAHQRRLQRLQQQRDQLQQQNKKTADERDDRDAESVELGGSKDGDERTDVDGMLPEEVVEMGDEEEAGEMEKNVDDEQLLAVGGTEKRCPDQVDVNSSSRKEEADLQEQLLPTRRADDVDSSSTDDDDDDDGDCIAAATAAVDAESSRKRRQSATDDSSSEDGTLQPLNKCPCVSMTTADDDVLSRTCNEGTKGKDADSAAIKNDKRVSDAQPTCNLEFTRVQTASLLADDRRTWTDIEQGEAERDQSVTSLGRLPVLTSPRPLSREEVCSNSRRATTKNSSKLSSQQLTIVSSDTRFVSGPFTASQHSMQQSFPFPVSGNQLPFAGIPTSAPPLLQQQQQQRPSTVYQPSFSTTGNGPIAVKSGTDIVLSQLGSGYYMNASAAAFGQFLNQQLQATYGDVAGNGNVKFVHLENSFAPPQHQTLPLTNGSACYAVFPSPLGDCRARQPPGSDVTLSMPVIGSYPGHLQPPSLILPRQSVDYRTNISNAPTNSPSSFIDCLAPHRVPTSQQQQQQPLPVSRDGSPDGSKATRNDHVTTSDCEAGFALEKLDPVSRAVYDNFIGKLCPPRSTTHGTRRRGGQMASFSRR